MPEAPSHVIRRNPLMTLLSSVRPPRGGIRGAVGGFLLIYLASALAAEAVIVAVLFAAGIDLRAAAIPDTLLTRAAPLYGFAMFALGAMAYWVRILGRPLGEIGLTRHGGAQDYAAGAAAGAAAVLASAGLVFGLGGFSFAGTAGADALPAGLVLLVGYAIQGFAEELLARGYLLTRLVESTTTLRAVLVSSLVFVTPHLPGLLAAGGAAALIGFVNTMLFAVLMCVLFMWRGSIWLVAAVHSSWNYTLGVVLGLSVSGGAAEGALLRVAPLSAVPLLTGGGYGIEAGLVVTVVLMASLTLAYGLAPAPRHSSK